MKRCPKCNRTYADDTLRFCLEDGSRLSQVIDPSDPSATVSVRDPNPPATERIVYDRSAPTLKVTGATIPSLASGDATPSRRDSQRPNTLLTAGVISIAILLLALVGIAAYFVLRQPGGESSQVVTGASPPVKQSASPGPTRGVNTPSPDNSEISTNAGLKITASASSVRYAVQNNTYYAANAIDGKRSTAWMEGVDGPGIGEWIRFDFDHEITLHRILIQPGYFKSPEIWAGNNRLAAVTVSFSDGSSRELNFTDVMQSQKFDVGSIRTKSVRFTIKEVYYGKDQDTAISEVAFEWEP